MPARGRRFPRRAGTPGRPPSSCLCVRWPAQPRPRPHTPGGRGLTHPPGPDTPQGKPHGYPAPDHPRTTPGLHPGPGHPQGAPPPRAGVPHPTGTPPGKHPQGALPAPRATPGLAAEHHAALPRLRRGRVTTQKEPRRVRLARVSNATKTTAQPFRISDAEGSRFKRDPSESGLPASGMRPRPARPTTTTDTTDAVRRSQPLTPHPRCRTRPNLSQRHTAAHSAPS